MFAEEEVSLPHDLQNGSEPGSAARMGAADLAPNTPVQVVLVKLLIISIFLFPICEMGIDVAFVLGLL